MVIVVGTRVALRFVPGSSREGIPLGRPVPHDTFASLFYQCSDRVLSSTLDPDVLLRLGLRNSVFRWTNGRCLRTLGSG